MKFLLGLFSLTYLMICGVAIGIALVITVFLLPAKYTEPKEFLIEKGMGTIEIAQKLAQENIIINPYPFIIGAKIKNSGKPIQAGEYLIPPESSMSSILDIMQNGKVIERKFTIPEGLTSWQIIQILNANDMLGGDILTEIPPEGSLMPDTYFFTRGDMRIEKIARMQQSMNEFLNTKNPDLLKGLPLTTFEEVIILASIVEKETSVPSEYEKVAGVFINRLNKGMPLQTDPTVIYGITNGQNKDEGQGPLGRRLLTKDLQTDTPYNTYTRNGLTPTAICNPGRKAIEAVLKPAKHDYLYFVADGTGGHAFAKNLVEHNINVAKWRKIRRAQ